MITCQQITVQIEEETLSIVEENLSISKQRGKSYWNMKLKCTYAFKVFIFILLLHPYRLKRVQELTYQNFHNNHIWSHNQYRFSVNVWAGIFGNDVIGLVIPLKD